MFRSNGVEWRQVCGENWSKELALTACSALGKYCCKTSQIKPIFLSVKLTLQCEKRQDFIFIFYVYLHKIQEYLSLICTYYIITHIFQTSKV